MISFLTGFIASVQHVVTGPDHMAAVMPLAIDSKKKSWLIGLGWGLGHTVGMLIIGGIFLLFKEILPIDAIAQHSDQLIGLLLIVIGSWSVLRTYLRYSHSNKTQAHPHSHQHVKPLKQTAFAAFGIGVIHGCSGFNHLLALLPTLALPTMRQSVFYITAFIAGTVTVMIIFACFMGFIAHRSEERHHHYFLKLFTYLGGTAAIIIGIIWLLGWGA